MPMTDPMDALRKLQEALDSGRVDLEPCDVHKHLRFIVDQPNGTPRFTYASLKGQQVLAVSIFALTEPVDGIHCFQVGYAVAESERNAGLGSKILAQGIDELKNGLSRTPIKKLYLEAVVSTSNIASNLIAQKLISNSPKAITDSFSGDDALHYLREVECVA